MRSHNLHIAPHAASWFLLVLLAPAEAAFLSWLSGNNGWNPTGGVKGSWSQINFGSVYEVTIQTQAEKDGACMDTVKIGLQGSKLGKTLETKCLESKIRKIRNEENLLLIGNPDDNFCVFTTNSNEVYYFQDGKWKKGDFSEDNAKDKELNPSEVATVKERINKWQAFFEKSKKEKERIKGLITAEKQRFQEEKYRFRNEREKERQTHKANVNEIYRLKTEESTKHTLERNNINIKLAKEGRTAAIKELRTAEEKRHENRGVELRKMRDEEDKRFKTAVNDIKKKFSSEEKKRDQEIRRLKSLVTEEERRALEELKENIKQGW